MQELLLLTGTFSDLSVTVKQSLYIWLRADSEFPNALQLNNIQLQN